MGARATTAIAVLLGMVLLLATGVVPSAIAGLVAPARWCCFAWLRSNKPIAASTGQRSFWSAP